MKDSAGNENEIEETNLEKALGVIVGSSGVKVQKIRRGLKMKIWCLERVGMLYILNFNCSCLQKKLHTFKIHVVCLNVKYMHEKY